MQPKKISMGYENNVLKILQISLDESQADAFKSCFLGKS